jgi:hypothetical protein
MWMQRYKVHEVEAFMVTAAELLVVNFGSDVHCPDRASAATCPYPKQAFHRPATRMNAGEYAYPHKARTKK